VTELKEVQVFIGLYDEQGKLIKDSISISHVVKRKLTTEELKESWRNTIKELKDDYREFMKLAQQR